MVDGDVIVYGFCLGSAVLAIWTVVRFPSFGPQRVLSAFVAAVIGTGVLPVAAVVFDVVVGWGRFAVALGLLAIVLPALTFAFWSAACALRALARGGGLQA
jgi:hypothetical protein